MIPRNERRKWETYLANKQLYTAAQWLEQAIKQYTDPASSIWLRYNGGVLYWGAIGNGEKARSHFIKTTMLFTKHPQFGETSNPLAHVQANACENLMLLSLDIDEFDSWRKRLANLQPDNEILHVLVPKVDELFDRGFNWGSILSAVMAGPHIRTEPDSVGGNYASGAAILQLVLKNRQNYGLSFEEWQLATSGYTGAVLKFVYDWGEVLHKRTGFPDPNELIFILEDALPYVQEFSAAYPEDERGKKCVADLEKLLQDANQTLKAGSTTYSILVSEATQCTECSSGMGLVTSVRTEDMATGKVRGALQCTRCKRIYCMECSDTALACYCGGYSWFEKLYVPTDPDPAFLIDETGEISSAMIGLPVKYFMPFQVKLPPTINPRKLNAYLKTRMRKKGNKTPYSCASLISIPALVFIGFIVYSWQGSWLWVLVAVAISWYLLNLMTSTSKSDWKENCQKCDKRIEITLHNPSSAWQCIHCGYEHFKYWEATSATARRMRKLS